MPDKLFLLVFNSGSYAFHAVTRDPELGPLAGLKPDALNRLVDRFTAYVLQSPETFLGEARPASASASGLTEGERRALAQGGVSFEKPAPGRLSAVERSRLEFGRLRVESLSVDELARLLGVDPSRIRQRLTSRPRTLFGIKAGRAWRIPKFQLDGKQLVPAAAL